MKKLFSLCLLSLTPYLQGSNIPSFIEVHDECSLVIETPALKSREVKKLKLANGLKVLIISDPHTHESGAALAVNVGSWDDPQERPGMAHFVEHLLFMGTEKYPEEEGYTRYLDEHGGSRNAFTMADRTVYMFSVNNEGFIEALDRFGQFFICPLFNPSGVERECKAIHQEYCKNLFLDSWRMLSVKKELANNDHPFHSFSIGNAETLASISQDEVQEWYKNHYSANLMHLVIYSPLDIETLEKEVALLFAQVKNKDKQTACCSQALVVEQDKPSICFISPVQDVQLLEMSWEIPRFYGKDVEIHADKLLSHILGHEGSSSLLAQLKIEKLAESLAVSNMRAGRDQCLLSLSIELTAKGIAQYEEVIERSFAFMQNLQKSPIPYYIYDEVCQIEELHYRFQSRPDVFDLVSEYAMRMIDEPLESFPQKTLIPSKYDPDKIKALLAHLTPRRCQYIVLAPERVTKVAADTKERWFGVRYAQLPIEEDKIKKWEGAANGQQALKTTLVIPRPNPFLPADLAVKVTCPQSHDILPTAVLIADEAEGRVFAIADSHFLIPHISWTFRFKTPQISDGLASSQVLADLYCHAVREALNAPAYEAMVGGLGFSLTPKHDALELRIKGYSDKAGSLLKLILDEMKHPLIDPHSFELYKQQFARDYSNTLKNNPLKQATDVLWTVLFKKYSSFQEKSEALEAISHEEMAAFCENVLSNCYVEATLYGNLSHDEAKELWGRVKTTLGFACHPPSLHEKIELACLPDMDRSAYLSIEGHNPSNALILGLDCGSFSFKRRAAQEILTKGLEEPFFSELRTRQQTAYLVSNSSQELERHLYSFFFIQSSSHDPRDLLARFELFLESSLQNLSEKVIPKERFDSIRAALIYQLKHPAETMSKMGSLLHAIAFQYDGDFSWLDKRIKGLEELSYEEFVSLSKEFLGKENKRRLAICVSGDTPNQEAVAYQKIKNPKELRNIIHYMGRQNQEKDL